MKYHQNLIIDGEEQPAEYRNRKDSAFFNEGKWKNFIAPLLPEDPLDRTFIEIGCNCGLFLKLATEYGFSRVIGVEADPDACAMAERYRDANGMDYKILNRTVGIDFDWDELPCADVVLMANMHYYIPLNEFLLFLDRMRWKTIYCLVVSRRMRDKKHGHPLSDIDALRLYFDEWEILRIIDTSSRMLESDPHPRRVHSMLFRSRLQRQPIEYHTKMWHDYPKQRELIDIVSEGRAFIPQQTMNWDYWVERKQTKKRGSSAWSDEEILTYVQHRYNLVKDIYENGMKEPIIVRPDRIGIDGGNRASILRLLGHRSIIVRIV